MAVRESTASYMRSVVFLHTWNWVGCYCERDPEWTPKILTKTSRVDGPHSGSWSEFWCWKRVSTRFVIGVFILETRFSILAVGGGWHMRISLAYWARFCTTCGWYKNHRKFIHSDVPSSRKYWLSRKHKRGSIVLDLYLPPSKNFAGQRIAMKQFDENVERWLIAPILLWTAERIRTQTPCHFEMHHHIWRDNSDKYIVKRAWHPLALDVYCEFLCPFDLGLHELWYVHELKWHFVSSPFFFSIRQVHT